MKSPKRKIGHLPEIVLVFLSLTVFVSWLRPADAPNIVLLLADDLGYGEVGVYGQEMIQTPVLDQLAHDGMRFTDFYAGNAVCSPSRAVLMTGKSSYRSSIRGNSGYMENGEWRRVALRKDEITLGEMLREAGYQTAFIGKWHLDDPNDLSTWAYHRGFDFASQEQWASRSGGMTFVENEEGRMEYINGMKEQRFYTKDGTWQCIDEFRTDIAFEYLETIDGQKPLFLMMSYRAPHKHEERVFNDELYADKGWPEGERMHAAKITLLDQQIGRLLTKLEEMGRLENTLVLFTSDNGPHQEGPHDPEFFDGNGIFRGIKRDVYEGGIRVPLIAYWNGVIVPGSVEARVAGFQDVMPTLAELAGIKPPSQTDGLSFLPVLRGEEAPPHENLRWEFQLDGHSRNLTTGGFRQSVRLGKWKGVRYGLTSPMELYDLENDPGEQNDLASSLPEQVAKLIALLNEQNRESTKGFPYGGVKVDREKP